MSTHAFDLPTFQAQFPELANLPGVVNGMYWGIATETMTADDGCILSGNTLQLALSLMTAHLAKLFSANGVGQVTGVLTSAGEGSVSAGFAPPPFRTGWQFWLSTTPYGQQLWALLQVQSAGGLYIGGSLERASFRKAGGYFGC